MVHQVFRQLSFIAREYPMTILKFTIVPTGVAQLHDILSCLAKFDENVSLEASKDYVRLPATPCMNADSVSFAFQV